MDCLMYLIGYHFSYGKKNFFLRKRIFHKGYQLSSVEKSHEGEHYSLIEEFTYLKDALECAQNYEGEKKCQ